MSSDFLPFLSKRMKENLRLILKYSNCIIVQNRDGNHHRKWSAYEYLRVSILLVVFVMFWIRESFPIQRNNSVLPLSIGIGFCPFKSYVNYIMTYVEFAHISSKTILLWYLRYKLSILEHWCFFFFFMKDGSVVQALSLCLCLSVSLLFYCIFIVHVHWSAKEWICLFGLKFLPCNKSCWCGRVDVYKRSLDIFFQLEEKAVVFLHLIKQMSPPPAP